MDDEVKDEVANKTAKDLGLISIDLESTPAGTVSLNPPPQTTFEFKGLSIPFKWTEHSLKNVIWSKNAIGATEHHTYPVYKIPIPISYNKYLQDEPAKEVKKPVPFYQSRTQKAKGVEAIQHYTSYGSIVESAHPVGVIDVREGKKPDLLWIDYPCFARPCPMNPRHGFVDSRTVNDEKELQQVIEETRAADPEGEVMIMDFIKAKLNMVWTPAFLTIGAGHDGATAGKDTVSFPLSGKWDSYIKKACKSAGVADYPYVEAVAEEYQANRYKYKLTQLRNGPELDSFVDFVPQPVTVTKVIQPNPKDGDLLAWETLMLKHKGEAGVVVYHPGGSQADHFSIHARSCQIPCITSFKPHVGDSLEAVGAMPPDYAAVVKGLVVGSKIELGAFKDMYGYQSWRPDAIAMLLGLHCSGAMQGEQAWWVGAAVAIMLRLGSMALRGEARHLKSETSTSRQALYARVAKLNLQAHANSCNSLINIFRYGWEYNATGVGGRKWAQCGLAIGDLFNTTKAFVETQTDDTYGAMLRAFNVSVNQAHNGGWWMNKFVDKHYFILAQKGDMGTVLEAVTTLWSLGSTYKNTTPAMVAATRKLWLGWKPTDMRPPRITQLAIKTTPAHGWVTLDIKDRLIGDKHVPLNLNLRDLFKRVPPDWPTEFHLRTADQGLALDVIFPGIIDEPLEVWREPVLKVQQGKAFKDEED